MKKKIITILSALFLLTGCVNDVVASNSTPKVKKILTNKANKVGTSDHLVKREIMEHFSEWKGTKYKWGGDTKKGIDCSAFIGKVYKNGFNIKLPRTTSDLKNEGIKVNKNNLKIGDMVFFRGNKHVGIYIGNNEFIHASSKKGVVKSQMSSGYYAKTYTQARRIIL